MAHAFVYSVLLFGEVPHVQFEDVSHQCVEHVEAGRLLDSSPTVVDHIEDGSEYFVHALHVLHLGVQPAKNKQDTSHVVIAIGGPQLFWGDFFPRALVSTDETVLFATGAGVEWDGEMHCWS